jgi:7,8-dihydroneopterin aldolase/epimerase/oxygenase
MTTIEIHGLELHGFHGVLPEERSVGQRFLFDISLVVEDERAAETDSIDDAVDYREVVAIVREVSEGTAFQLLEALAAAAARTLLDRLAVAHVRVRVRKPDVLLGFPVDYSAVVVELTGSD